MPVQQMLLTGLRQRWWQQFLPSAASPPTASYRLWSTCCKPCLGAMASTCSLICRHRPRGMHSAILNLLSPSRALLSGIGKQLEGFSQLQAIRQLMASPPTAADLLGVTISDYRFHLQASLVWKHQTSWSKMQSNCLLT